ncbi:hypothetical protein BDB01DRAFT_838593 [Pilobolus umbonatus]|nr:hypothetical protein BDB01DRAFT_838593 [Pilobolus umbonatus]
MGELTSIDIYLQSFPVLTELALSVPLLLRDSPVFDIILASCPNLTIFNSIGYKLNSLAVSKLIDLTLKLEVVDAIYAQYTKRRLPGITHLKLSFPCYFPEDLNLIHREIMPLKTLQSYLCWEDARQFLKQPVKNTTNHLTCVQRRRESQGISLLYNPMDYRSEKIAKYIHTLDVSSLSLQTINELFPNITKLIIHGWEDIKSSSTTTLNPYLEKLVVRVSTHELKDRHFRVIEKVYLALRKLVLHIYSPAGRSANFFVPLALPVSLKSLEVMYNGSISVTHLMYVTPTSEHTGCICALKVKSASFDY